MMIRLFIQTSAKHHEDNECFRLNFRKDVQTVFNAILSNPFLFAPSVTLHIYSPNQLQKQSKLCCLKGRHKLNSSSVIAWFYRRLLSRKRFKKTNFLYQIIKKQALQLILEPTS